MPPSLDKPGVRLGGISEACGYNDHTDCRVMGCGCDCHIRPSQEEVQAKLEAAAGKGPEKACPKCGVKRPFTEVYCRIDGERLASLLCGMCGAGMEVEDGFCWKCSSPKGKVAASGFSVPDDRSVPAIQAMDEVDDGQAILRELQRELGEQGEESDRPQGSQEVVEQPAGTQGPFKIVSKPNPNKLRTGSSIGVPGPVSQGPQTGAVPSGKPVASSAKPFRLPVKPS